MLKKWVITFLCLAISLVVVAVEEKAEPAPMTNKRRFPRRNIVRPPKPPTDNQMDCYKTQLQALGADQTVTAEQKEMAANICGVYTRVQQNLLEATPTATPQVITIPTH